MFGQQARRFQRLAGDAPEPGHAQLQAQRLDAPTSALGQFGQVVAGGLHIAVLHGPARRAQQGAFTRFRRALCQPGMERGLQVFVARTAVLQRLGRLGHQQVGEQLQLLPARPLGRGLRVELLQRGQAGRPRAHKTARQQLGQRIHHGAHGSALHLLVAPALGLQRQFLEHCDGAHGQVQQHKATDQAKHHKVERHVEPVRRPEERHHGLVVSDEQGQRDRQRGQTEQPEHAAHGAGLTVLLVHQRPPAATASAARLSSG